MTVAATPPALPTATILAGASLSDAVSLGGGSLVALVMPDGWDAAEVTFQASADGTVFGELYRQRERRPRVWLDASAGQYIALDPADFPAGIVALKLRSGTAGNPIPQTADRAIGLVVEGGAAPVAAKHEKHARGHHAEKAE